jgi:hypothetical protein
MIIQGSRLFLLALSLLFFRSLPFKKESNKLKSFWELSYFILLIPLLMPHQQKYAFLLALPMIIYLIYFFISIHPHIKSTLYYLVLVVFILCILIYSPLYGSDIIGKFVFDLTQYYRLLTIATLLIIPISIYCNPHKLNKYQIN